MCIITLNRINCIRVDENEKGKEKKNNFNQWTSLQVKSHKFLVEKKSYFIFSSKCVYNGITCMDICVQVERLEG